MNNVIAVPTERSKKVSILVTPNRRAQRGDGDKLEHDRLYIGASLKNRSPLTGITPQEENRFLPEILGMTATDNGWKAAVRNYWNSIRKVVPDDNTGLVLEVGLSYDSQQDAIDGINGYPLDVSDYILWRYCLKYSKVANTVHELGMSPKILFYLSDPQSEENVEYNKVQRKMKAEKYLTSLTLPQHTSKLDDVLTIYGYNISSMSLKNKIITIHGLGSDDESNPKKLDKFIATYDDKILRSRAWVARAVSYDIIKRLPNTDTIQYRDHITLGTTTEATIAYLDNDPQGQMYKLEIGAALDTKSKGALNTEDIDNRQTTYEVAPVNPVEVAQKGSDVLDVDENDPLGGMDGVGASGPNIDTTGALSRKGNGMVTPPK